MAPTLMKNSLLAMREDSSSDQNRDREVYAVAAVFLPIAFAGLVARLLSKSIKRRTLEVDDYLLVWAFVLSVGEACSFIWAAKYAGLGHHMATLDEAKIIGFEKVFYADSLVQPCLLASSKISVLILLHRIFITKAFRITAKILMAIVVGWYIAISFAGAFICSPVTSNWNPALPAHCGNRYVLNIVDPLPWILTDFAILICPLPVVRKLQMPIRQKVALAGIFLIGALTCIVSCIRYRYAFFSLTDPTWDTIGLLNWNIIEANVTILCACLIASKPVAMFLIPDRLISGLDRFIARFSRSQRMKLDHDPRSGQSKALFDGRSHIQNGRSFKSHLTAVSHGTTEDTLLEGPQALSLPQPAKSHSHL